MTGDGVEGRRDRIAVLLADDHPIVRRGVRALLEAEPDIAVIGEARDGAEAVDLAVELAPDVVVMDIAMPRLNGIDASLRIQRSAPGVRILILSAHGDDPYIERVMSLGDVGYVLKQSALEDLPAAIRATCAGGRAFRSPAIRRRMLASSQRAAGERLLTSCGGVPRLSHREAEVLQLIAEGRANKQIAQDLGISIKTVEKHRQRVMSRLDIHDVAGLTRYAVTVGVIECRGGGVSAESRGTGSGRHPLGR